MTLRSLTAVLVLLTVARLTAFSQQGAVAAAPKAAEIAGKFGETVEFEDEVKATSYSKSTKGYYLSFGEAYPKQVLSVWVSGELYEKLAGRHAMVGRTVRITGQVQKGDEGPLVKLESRDQFKLIAVDETVLSKPSLDGKQDRDKFRAAVWQTFKRDDFATLEELGQEVRKSRERLNDGTWLSEAFLSAFRLGPKMSKETYIATEERLARWEQAYPNSTILPIVQVGYHLDLAWRWRGTAYASKVSEEGWHGFQSELAIARQILESKGEKAYPEYYVLMEVVALGQGWKKEEFMKLFQQATTIEPDYPDFYTEAAWYLLPRWHGEKGEWEKFAEEQREMRGAGGAGDAIYARIAWFMRNYYDNVFKDSAVSWDHTASGFEYLIRQYPQSRYLKSVYANLCWKAGDRARLRKALPASAADPDMSVWVNLENVGLAEKFAGLKMP